MTEFIPPDSCATDESPTILRVDQARQAILENIEAIAGWHTVALRDALDRVLFSTVIASHNVPPHNNSAMDGYAVRSQDCVADRSVLQQVGTAYAGKPFSGQVFPGQCVRIMTGAVMPEGCDSVVMQEHVESQGEQVICHSTPHAGQHVRLAGEDIEAGDDVLPAGKRLTPADLGLLASLGQAEVRVRRTLKVAFFSTGDELRALGETCAPGDIYDSNRYTLYGMLRHLHVDLLDMGVVKDEPEALRTALLTAAESADVLITSGGVSVGDADHVKTVLTELGQINFWKIAMKPGRPLTFGTLADTPFFGLPGNPVSAMVTFYQFVKPALEKRAGMISEPPLTLSATAANDIRKRSGRFEFQRGILRSEHGRLMVEMAGEQGSGILRSMSLANCFILLDENCQGVTAGDTVIVQPFAGLI